MPRETDRLVGETLSANEAAATYVKAEFRVADVPSGFVTATFLAPTEFGGVTAMMLVDVVELTVAANPPIATVAPL